MRERKAGDGPMRAPAEPRLSSPCSDIRGENLHRDSSMMSFSQQLVRALVHPDKLLRKRRRGHEERRLPPGGGRERVRAGPGPYQRHDEYQQGRRAERAVIRPWRR